MNLFYAFYVPKVKKIHYDIFCLTTSFLNIGGGGDIFTIT